MFDISSKTFQLQLQIFDSVAIKNLPSGSYIYLKTYI